MQQHSFIAAFVHRSFVWPPEYSKTEDRVYLHKPNSSIPLKRIQFYLSFHYLSIGQCVHQCVCVKTTKAVVSSIVFINFLGLVEFHMSMYCAQSPTCAQFLCMQFSLCSFVHSPLHVEMSAARETNNNKNIKKTHNKIPIGMCLQQKSHRWGIRHCLYIYFIVRFVLLK